MKTSRLLMVGLSLCPGLLFGQKNEIISMQRDVAQLADQVKQLQHSLDEQMKQVTALVQQSVDSSRTSASGMTNLQRDVDQKLADIQTRLTGPVATLGTKVDQMSDDLRAVRENVADLVKRMGKMDAAITDISSAVRTLNTPAATPQAGGSAIPGGAASTVGGAPAGMSAELSYQNALRDYNSGKSELAFDEFRQYLKYFPQTENAPSAQYYIGMIYLNADQFDDSVQSFEAVVDKFPENPKNPEALYMKGVALQKWAGHKTEAGRAYRELIRRYPDSSNVPNAHKHLKELGLEPSTVTKKRG